MLNTNEVEENLENSIQLVQQRIFDRNVSDVEGKDADYSITFGVEIHDYEME